MKQYFSILLAAFAMLILSSCKLSQDLASPADATPVAYRTASTIDTANIALTNWKQYFPDPALQQLIDTALHQNFDLQVAVKNIDAAQLRLKQSKLEYWPAVYAQANASISRPSDNSLNGISLSQFLGKSYIENYTLSAVVSWEADIWGKIKNRKAAALAEYLQTVEAKKAIQTELVAAVAKGYYNLLMLDEQIAIARSNVSLNDSTLNIIQLQYNAGDATGLAIQQTAAQRLLATQLIPQLEQEIMLQENALSILVGHAPADVDRESDLQNKEALMAQTGSGIPAALLENRPDIRASALAINIANANSNHCQGKYVPLIIYHCGRWGECLPGQQLV